MNTNDTAKCDSTVRRNLRRKNIDLRPLRLPSLLGLIIGVLMFMVMGAPSAHATPTLLTYFDFNDSTAVPAPSDVCVGCGQATTLFSDAASFFGVGQLTVQPLVGTTQNQFTGDVELGGNALEVRGNANGHGPFCVDIGPINTTGKTIIALSFALQSIGNGTQFNNVQINYSTTNLAGSYVSAGPSITINQDGLYHTYGLTLPPGAGNQTTLYIQLCFQGSTDDREPNHTYIDNIQVTGDVPEPTTAISGVLAAVGLCWRQRKRLSTSGARGSLKGKAV